MEEISKVCRAIAPPIVFAVHAASADWGIPLQIAARRERKVHDFMADCFVKINAK